MCAIDRAIILCTSFQIIRQWQRIALDFWRQYQFTGDRNFLEARALPYILAAAQFFESLFEKDEYGALPCGRGDWIRRLGKNSRDPITELVYASVLFKVAIDALNEAGTDDSHAAKWQDILDSLAPLPTFDLGGIYIEKGNIQAYQRSVQGAAVAGYGSFRSRFRYCRESYASIKSA